VCDATLLPTDQDLSNVLHRQSVVTRYKLFERS
jgi:hypothetical protein